MVDPLIACEEALIARFSLLSSLRIQATRTRYHGHLGLENLLHSGNDFVFIDFEGDPATHLSERSIKRTPLRDLASLLHSFGCAVHTGILRETAGAQHTALSDPQLRTLGTYWYS